MRNEQKKHTSKRKFQVEALEDRRLMAVVYGDGLASNWQNWSWETAVNPSSGAQVYSGSASMAVRHTGEWGGLYLRNNAGVNFSSTDEVRFQIHGGSGGQQLKFFAVDTSDTFIEMGDVTPTAGQWTEFTMDFPEFGAPQDIVGLVLQEYTGNPANLYYVDQIEIGDYVIEPGGETLPGPNITINANTVNGQISDGVYGLNFADPQLAADIDLPVNRWGGNSTTRFNYQLDATNLASDFFFENYPNENDNVAQLPLGNASDTFVEENQQSGAETIMTIGTIGWTPNSRQIQGSFPVDVYGPQQEVNMYRPNHGNGVALDGSFIQNDPSITSNQIDETFATGWINHLTSQHGAADDGGVRYYALDNEPMLWNSTHRDVHPEPASYDEVRDKGVSYAAAVKQADPDAQVLGPSVWGWTAYWYSALDAAPGGAWWNNPQDRNAHGGEPFLPWYLGEMAAAETQTGTRLLDYLDIHYYPQAEGVALEPAGDLDTQARRLRTTRSLWDPSYQDESWINEDVQLIPRMRDWIDSEYPGTKLAITEYNFGGVEHINGAVTQADVLGIFGREGVDIATMWGPPDADDPAGYAFRMFRNYDGVGTDGSKFGETSLGADSGDSDQVSVFASQRQSDGATTVVLINKTTEARETPVDFSATVGDVAAEIYTYDSSNLNQIVRGSDVMIDDGQIELTLPAYSITLLELPGDGDGIRGDFNSDGTIDVADIDLICEAVHDGNNAAFFDLTGDGLVDSADMDEMILNVVGTLHGDANLDRVVDISDFNVWNANKFSTDRGWSGGDFNCDGVTDISDFNVWNSNKFQSANRAMPNLELDKVDAEEEDDSRIWQCIVGA